MHKEQAISINALVNRDELYALSNTHLAQPNLLDHGETKNRGTLKRIETIITSTSPTTKHDA